MNIGVVGTGYVGLVVGACLAENGNTVTCVDADRAKVDALRRGEIPIYEPGLNDMVPRNVAGERLAFTTDLETTVKAIKGRGAKAVAGLINHPAKVAQLQWPLRPKRSR